MSNLPKCVDKKPSVVELEAGKDYFFCTCGLSAKQPFCDGAHKGTEFRSHKFTAEQNGIVSLCMCKKTKKVPFCDGTHSDL